MIMIYKPFFLFAPLFLFLVCRAYQATLQLYITGIFLLVLHDILDIFFWSSSLFLTNTQIEGDQVTLIVPKKGVLGDGLGWSDNRDVDIFSSRSGIWRCTWGFAIRFREEECCDCDAASPPLPHGDVLLIRFRHGGSATASFVLASTKLRDGLGNCSSDTDVVLGTAAFLAPSTASKRLDLLLFCVRLFCLRKYFWAWLAT
uniref:Uncharacterized protein n=1 Tax=Arundo donax TaxID=35708 RepID=A0A0A9ELA2_ARUDO